MENHNKNPKEKRKKDQRKGNDKDEPPGLTNSQKKLVNNICFPLFYIELLLRR